jgi:protein-disulfide isomerase
MPSGKRSRERRRASAPPPVRRRGAPRSRKASPRVLIAAAGLAILIAVAVVLAVVLTGGSSKKAENVPTVGTLTNALTGAADVDALFKGVPQSGTTLGSPKAPVTLVEYIDLQCPYCQQFETEVIPGVVDKYVRTGKVRIVMRPWAFIGPDSTRGQAAVLAAGEQNRAFNYASLLYANQRPENSGWLDDTIVARAAASIPGLDVQRLLSDRTSSKVKAEVNTIGGQAQADQVNATPTLFVGKTGSHGTQVVLTSPSDKATLAQAIEAALGS